MVFGVVAYLMWGAFPLYWPLLAPAGAFEILAHRLVWSMVVMAGLIIGLRRTPQLWALVRDRRRLTLLAIAGVTVTCNWATYIWGVNHGRVVETSLGYFVNPLVTMLLGVLVLRERMRPAQWVAVGIATVAVLVLTLDYGRLPWLALLLAFSFGTYGLVKKKAAAGATATRLPRVRRAGNRCRAAREGRDRTSVQPRPPAVVVPAQGIALRKARNETALSTATTTRPHSASPTAPRSMMPVHTSPQSSRRVMRNSAPTSSSASPTPTIVSTIGPQLL